MNNYTNPVTVTGNPASFEASGSGKLLSLSVPFSPIQSLHGYSNPWPAGGGKNKLPPTTSVSGTQNGVTFTVNSDGSVSTSGTATGTAIFTYFINFTDLTENEQYILSGCPTGGGMSSKYKLDYRVSGGYMTDTGAGASFTFVPFSSGNSIRIVVYSGTNASGLVFKPMIRLASVSDATFAPYSNICPINGLTGLSVYVSPTQDQQDATTYAEDWTSQAGTVYGGRINIVSGSLKTRPHYASYNGETLVGPWVSSMDEYAAGTSPTTGAEVVDLGGAETTYQLTPTQISLLTGQNYLWASNGGTLTAVTGGRTELTIDTDQVGNQCLSIGIANYDVEKFGRIETRLGTSKLVQTKTSAAYPNPKNQYMIDGNAFLNPNAPPLYDIDVSPTYEYIYVILERLWNLTPSTPIQTKLVWDWSIDAGDLIQVKRNNVTYVFPIFQVAMTWRGGYVVADVMNDGDVVKPYTDGIDNQNKGTISKFVVNGGTGTVSTDVSFTPGESALVVISGAATVRTAAFIVHCGADGTILKRDISSGSAYSYVTSTPYTVTIQNSSHVNNSGLRISF